jgi:hypothetical protein
MTHNQSHKHYHIAFKLTRRSAWQLDSAPFTSYKAAERMLDSLEMSKGSINAPYRQKIVELSAAHCEAQLQV